MAARSYPRAGSPPRSRRERPRVARVTLDLDPGDLHVLGWRIDARDYLEQQRVLARVEIFERILRAIGRELERELAA